MWLLLHWFVLHSHPDRGRGLRRWVLETHAHIHNHLHTGTCTCTKNINTAKQKLNMCICLCSYSEYICIHIWIHIKTCLFVKINANELKCWWTGRNTSITGLTSAGRGTMSTSLGISHYLSKALNLVLDRRWTGTLPSSQMKNAHLMRKDRDDGDDGGGRLHQVIQICYTCRHIPRHTFGDMQENKQAHASQ